MLISIPNFPKPIQLLRNFVVDLSGCHRFK